MYKLTPNESNVKLNMVIIKPDIDVKYNIKRVMAERKTKENQMLMQFQILRWTYMGDSQKRRLFQTVKS